MKKLAWFNSDVASLLDVPTSQVVKEIPKRFQNLSSGEADLYEKVSPISYWPRTVKKHSYIDKHPAKTKTNKT